MVDRNLTDIPLAENPCDIVTLVRITPLIMVLKEAMKFVEKKWYLAPLNCLDIFRKNPLENFFI